MSDTQTLLDTLLTQEVVIDVRSQYVFLGHFVEYDDHYLVLQQADVHDLRDSSTTREMYVLEAKRHGYPYNRDRVLLRREEAISISLLSDVSE